MVVSESTVELKQQDYSDLKDSALIQQIDQWTAVVLN